MTFKVISFLGSPMGSFLHEKKENKQMIKVMEKGC
jgi:hypothetical protein